MFPFLSPSIFWGNLGFLGLSFIILVGILPMVFYIFSSIGYQTMAKARGIEYPWLAWLPVLRLYLLGEIVGEKMVFIRWTIHYVQVIAPVLVVVSFLFLGLSWIGPILAVLYLLVSYTLAYRLLRLYDDAHATTLLLLSIVLPFLLSLYPFILRHRVWTEYL